MGSGCRVPAARACPYVHGTTSTLYPFFILTSEIQTKWVRRPGHHSFGTKFRTTISICRDTDVCLSGCFITRVPSINIYVSLDRYLLWQRSGTPYPGRPVGQPRPRHKTSPPGNQNFKNFRVSLVPFSDDRLTLPYCSSSSLQSLNDIQCCLSRSKPKVSKPLSPRFSSLTFSTPRLGCAQTPPRTPSHDFCTPVP